MVLVHDDDLERINGIGEGRVSGHFLIHYIDLPMSAVTGIPPTRNDNGSPPEFRHRDT
jgi:hypothetical protein